MRHFSLILTAAVFAAPIAAGAQTNPATTPVAASAPVSGDANKEVCETVGQTGSRLSRKRICHTVSEWTAIRAEERRAIERIQANRYKGNE